MKPHKTQRQRRASRVRKTYVVHGGRPRLSVFRSQEHIYAQVIDDARGHTVASASSLEKTWREAGNKGSNKDAASAVGKLIAERAVAAGVTDVVFDRGAYLYHGRVKALADGAREGGLNF
ncbi:MAG: 50S ribosomal protein L18 [Bauldia sp.]